MIFSIMAEILVRGWQTAYKGIVDEVYLQSLSSRQFCARMVENKKNNQFLVAEINGEVVAFCRYSLQIPPETQGDFDGTISELYVKPELKGRGIGSALFQAVLEDFKCHGNRCVVLGCFSKNYPFLAFYEKMQGKLIGEDSIALGGKSYPMNLYQFLI